MKPRFWYLGLAWWGSLGAFAQSSATLNLRDESHNYFIRKEIQRSEFGDVHTAIQPMLRTDVYSNIPDTNARLLIYIPEEEYLERENSEFVRPAKIWEYYKRDQAHLITINHPREKIKRDFNLFIDPILYLKAGAERHGDSTDLIYTNVRGIQLRGHINQRVYFQSDILETQALFPTYIQNRILAENAVPNAGFYKPFDSRLTPRANDGVDYLLAQGLIGFNATKNIGFQFGHGRNFIGDGHRSLFLSDFSNNYLYLKINTRVWKFHYQNIFAQLTQDHLPRPNRVVPKKYMAAHYLSMNVAKNVNIGIFESVVFGQRTGFEFQYLNPIILYRAVEQGLGSPDNVTLGVSAKWNFLKQFSLYGQAVFDEFVFSELFVKRQGWWGNKYGVQLGLKWVDMFKIKYLDAQAEFNTVRPYTYTSIDSNSNYTHYNQPLAHALGSNFREFIGMLSWRPRFNWRLRGQLNYIQQGLDTAGSNYGSNIHLSYTTRPNEYGNKTLQGVRSNTIWGSFTASWEFKHNWFADLQYIYRRQSSDVAAYNSTAHIFTLALRVNFWETPRDY